MKINSRSSCKSVYSTFRASKNSTLLTLIMMAIKIHSNQNVQFLGFLRVAETRRRRRDMTTTTTTTTGLMNRFERYIPSIFRFFFQRLVTTTTSAAHPQKKSFQTIKPDDSSSSSSSSSSDSWRSVKLTEQQELVLNAISSGKSVFITGSAGTGKTFLLKEAINLLKEIHNPAHVYVTASTGVSACALNGQTLHSFAGVGLGNGDKEFLFDKVSKNSLASRRWRNAKALVIDEISMVSSEFFEKLEHIARKMRKSRKDGKAWGGIQLIVSGDFFQLPPIIKDRSPLGKEFAFEADCWDSSFDLQVELAQVFRQLDLDFIDLLQGIRRGHKDPQHLQLLYLCSDRSMDNEIESSKDDVPKLFPRNQDVKLVNDAKLKSLGGEIVKYRALDTGSEPWKRQLKQGIAPEELEICLGARVMLIKNLDLDIGLVNGAIGTVTGFVEHGGLIRKICSNGLSPIVRFDMGKEMTIEPESWDVMEGDTKLATRKQVPLMLAWALSIHKCQGMTIDCLHTDLSCAFGCGMVYVALSRVRNLKGLHLSGFKASKIKAHPKVLDFYYGMHQNQLE